MSNGNICSSELSFCVQQKYFSDISIIVFLLYMWIQCCFQGPGNDFHLSDPKCFEVSISNYFSRSFGIIKYLQRILLELWREYGRLQAILQQFSRKKNWFQQRERMRSSMSEQLVPSFTVINAVTFLQLSMVFKFFFPIYLVIFCFFMIQLKTWIREFLLGVLIVE